MISPDTTRERFLNKPIKIERTAGWECWLWQGKLDDGGYAIIRVDDHRMNAHRFSYELLVGPIPDGLVVDHLCRRRHCINPDHLEPVTNEENVRRGAHKHAGQLVPRETCDKGHVLTGDNLYINDQGW